MRRQRSPDVVFVRLTEIPLEILVAHMSDPRMADHMPLLATGWDRCAAERFVAAKEEGWHRDGLGHCAILRNGRYVGWGGFQREGEEWDSGLVPKPEAFGFGPRILRQAIAFARSDPRIPYMTFLLPPSRRKLGALDRLGARFVVEVDHGGTIFLKYRLATPPPRATDRALAAAPRSGDAAAADGST